MSFAGAAQRRAARSNPVVVTGCSTRVGAMPDVAVVTDTTHYLPRETVAELGVGEVSLYVNDGARQEREADIVDLTAFYDGLRTAASLPTTSQPSIGDFLAV